MSSAGPVRPSPTLLPMEPEYTMDPGKIALIRQMLEQEEKLKARAAALAERNGTISQYVDPLDESGRYVGQPPATSDDMQTGLANILMSAFDPQRGAAPITGSASRGMGMPGGPGGLPANRSGPRPPAPALPASEPSLAVNGQQAETQPKTERELWQQAETQHRTERKYATTGTRKLADTLVKQYQGILRDEKEGTSTFKTRGVRADQLAAKVSKDMPGDGNMAEFYNTGTLSENMKAYPNYYDSGNLKSSLRDVGKLNINPESLARSADSPQKFAWDLISTLSHELGMHSQKTGGNHPDLKQWSTKERFEMKSISDVPKSVKVAQPAELINQFGLDAARARMLDTPLARTLLDTAKDPNSPIAVSWRALRGTRD